MSQATDLTPSIPAAPARPNEMNLIWVDMEMTGLEPDTDRIIEVAVVVTDMHLNLLAEGPVFAIHQSDETLNKMDAWNKGTHGRSGLIDRVKASTVTEAQAEAELIAFLKNTCQLANRRCAATPLARTAASWCAACRNSKRFSTIATSMCRP